MLSEWRCPGHLHCPGDADPHEMGRAGDELLPAGSGPRSVLCAGREGGRLVGELRVSFLYSKRNPSSRHVAVASP